MSLSNKRQYEVDRVVGKRIQKGRVLYLIKWKGYGEEDNTWELEQHCRRAKKAILDYERMAYQAESIPKLNGRQKSKSRKRSKNNRNESRSAGLDDSQNQGTSGASSSNSVQEPTAVLNGTEAEAERNLPVDVPKRKGLKRNKKLKTE